MSTKLFVGPFPKFLNEEEKKTLLSYYGAIGVDHVIKKNKSYSIAVFKNHVDCEYALRKLHQLVLFGKRLSAQFYDFSGPYKRLSTGKASADEEKRFNCQKENLFKYEAQLSAISSNFNILSPISPKLKYCYPPPSPLVLSNIAHALIAVPKFYTQVLHLMNKMNLPCPFGPLTEEPPICKKARLMTKAFDTPDETQVQSDLQKTPDITSKDDIQVSEEEVSESELESDEEIKLMYNKEKIAPKRRLKRKSSKVIKRPKLDILKLSLLQSRESSTQEPKDDSQTLKEVFDMPNLNPKRTLNVHVQSTILDSGALAKGNDKVAEEGFGKIYPVAKSTEEANPKDSSHISLEELESNRIPTADWPVVPVFKKYNRGVPSPRIYIKNLAKAVTENDLRFIFGRYVIPESDDTSVFNIRLMKEGRMKGQAFINFSSEEIAAKAIDEVNGFIFKDKPMVICFGKVKPVDESGGHS